MRLEELYLDGFGHFNQTTIGPISGPGYGFLRPQRGG